mmetsp:Transcript_5398/g.5558  ORF Transcript_5398/g.5558 Transcript_5398/m.5558 type:complete len:161 (+) Transcript_5398:1-483(+)
MNNNDRNSNTITHHNVGDRGGDAYQIYRSRSTTVRHKNKDSFRKRDMMNNKDNKDVYSTSMEVFVSGAQQVEEKEEEEAKTESVSKDYKNREKTLQASSRDVGDMCLQDRRRVTDSDDCAIRLNSNLTGKRKGNHRDKQLLNLSLKPLNSIHSNTNNRYR